MKEIQNIDSKKHLEYIDFIRVIASLMVVAQHVVGNYLNNGYADFSTYEKLILISIWAISQPAVPLFVMITGVTMLNRNIPIKTLYNKYIKKLAISFIVFLIVYLIYKVHMDYTNNWITADYIKNLPANLMQTAYHLWFYPMIIGLYMIVPLLSKVVEDGGILKYIIKLVFVFLIVSTTIDALSLFNIIDLHIFVSEIRNFFPILIVFCIFGYYIENNTFKITQKQKIWWIVASLLLFLFYMYILMYNSRSSSMFSAYSFRNTIYSLTICYTMFFMSKLYYTDAINKKIKALVSSISKHTLGIYLVHLLFVNYFFNTFKFTVVNEFVTALVSIVIVYTISLLRGLMGKKLKFGYTRIFG